ncbi:hypothetical protein ACQP2X_24705 [Actinoplanes sp. CA-131856]
MALEVAKLVVEALTPLAVVAVGYVLNRRLRKVEQAQWANQTVITRRLQIFDKLAPPLNRMLCFATFVGRWKEIEPAQVIALKRETDETMYANRLLFSDDLFTAYQAFMSSMFAMFAMFATTDADAPLRAPISQPGRGDRRNLPWWNPTLQSCFSTSEPATPAEISAAYDALTQQFRSDLYVLPSR